MKSARDPTAGNGGGRSPHAVDAYVGGRIRLRRKALKVSQQALAEALGLTFQQVQKYERGANRVSASKLFEIAAFLQTPLSSFFEGLEPTQEGSEEASAQSAAVHAFLMSSEGIELATIMPRLRPRIRRQLLMLTRVLAETTGAEPD